LRQRGRVEAHDPSVVRQRVFVAGPRDEDDAVRQGERGALVFHPGVERHHLAGRAGNGVECGSVHRGGNGDWASGSLAAGRDVERVHALDVGAVLLGPRDQIHRRGGSIDDRRALDADVAEDIVPGAGDIEHGHGRDALTWIGEVSGPQRRRRRAIGVERIHLVVHRRDIDDVAKGSVDRDARDVQRLRVDGAVDRV